MLTWAGCRHFKVGRSNRQGLGRGEGGRGWADLHDKNPDSIGGSRAQVQRLGGTYHNVNDGHHKPGHNQEGHQPVDVLNVLPCRASPQHLARCIFHTEKNSHATK